MEKNFTAQYAKDSQRRRTRWCRQYDTACSAAPYRLTPIAGECEQLHRSKHDIAGILGLSKGRFVTMKTLNHDIAVRRLDEWRYAVSVDGIVRHVGSQEECERRVAILAPNDDRAAQDKALARLASVMR